MCAPTTRSPSNAKPITRHEVARSAPCREAVRAGATFEAGTPEALFQTRSAGLAPSTTFSQQYDVTPDGQRFLLTGDVSEANAVPLTVVLDWTASLQK